MELYRRKLLLNKLLKQNKPSNSWTSNLPKDKQEEFSKRLLAVKDLFQRLSEIIEVKNKDNTKARIAKSSYDKPAFSEYQADANGYARALEEVQQLLQFTKE